MGFIASILAALGLKAASACSQACMVFFFEEEDVPRSLLK